MNHSCFILENGLNNSLEKVKGKMGQYIQDGRKNIFETTLNIERSVDDVIIKKDDNNLDGLNYLEGRSLDYINKKAMDAVVMAHVQGGVV